MAIPNRDQAVSLRPITQAESDAWDAQPGTDVYGRPWSSWDRVIVSDRQADLIAAQLQMCASKTPASERSRHAGRAGGADNSPGSADTQMQLAL
jgi:hypothetical protein